MSEIKENSDPTPADELAQLRQRCERAEQALAEIESRDRLLGEVAPFGIFTLDHDGTVTGFNSKVADLLPWPVQDPSEAVNLFGFEPLMPHPLLADIRQCLGDRQARTTNHYHTVPDGSSRHLRYHISPIPSPDGGIAGVMVFVEDISSLKLVEDALMESEKKYRALFEHTPIALIERDASDLKQYLDQLREAGVTELRAYFEAAPGEIARCMQMIKTTACNQAFLDLIEARNIAEISAFFKTFSEAEDVRVALEIICMIAGEKTSDEREATFYTIKNNQKSVLGRSLVVSGHESSFSRVIVALVDISRRKQAEEALRASEKRFREQSLRDNLTKLFNRRYLYQSLAEQIDAFQDQGKAISVLFFDLDDFKQVVDTHGHIHGSQVIREVAVTIREALRPPEFAVAYAGDEFVVVLPESDFSVAQQRAKDIQSRIARTGYLNADDATIRLTASVGAASFPDHAGDLNELLAAADRALFAAKETRKKRSRC